MKSVVKKVLKWTGIVLVGLIVLGAIFGHSSKSKPSATADTQTQTVQQVTTVVKTTPAPKPKVVHHVAPKPDPWQALVGCLKNHPLFQVDAYSGVRGTLPDGARRSVEVWQDVEGHVVAYVGDYGTAHAATAAAGSYNPQVPAQFHAYVAGSLVYQWATADELNQSDIEACLS